MTFSTQARMSKFSSVMLLISFLPLAGCEEWRRPEATPVNRAVQRPTAVKPASSQNPPGAPAREPRKAPAAPREQASKAPPQAAPAPKPAAAADAVAFVDGFPVAR